MSERIPVNPLRLASTQWDTDEQYFDVSGATPVKVAGIDAQRWMIAFAVELGAVWISTKINTGLASNVGFRVPTSAPPEVLTYKDWGGFISGDWYALGGFGATLLTVWTARIKG